MLCYSVTCKYYKIKSKDNVCRGFHFKKDMLKAFTLTRIKNTVLINQTPIETLLGCFAKFSKL